MNENVSLEEFKNIILNKKNNYRNKKLALVTEVSNDKINIYTEENIKYHNNISKIFNGREDTYLLIIKDLKLKMQIKL